MSKARIVKPVVYLIVVVIYIHVSGFMAHYYNDNDFKKNPTTVNRLLFQPIGAVTEFLPQQLPDSQKDNLDKFVDNLVERGAFYVFFFSWPLLVLCALIYWLAVVIIFLILILSIWVSLILSLILWWVTYILLGFRIF